MTYTNSPLVSCVRISPNRNSPRNHAIDTVSVHCTAGQCSAETLGALFAQESRAASSNYGIGRDGEIGMYVEERDRSWCTSSAANDNRAITVEVASDSFHPYRTTEKAFASLLTLLTDICRRNGAKKLLWFGDKAKTLAYTPKDGEMVMTVHRWFDAKSCPGDYLFGRHGEIAAEVTRRLGGESPAEDPLYRVRERWEDAASQVGAFRQLENAVRCADAHPGYSVFDAAGQAVYPKAEFVPYTVRIACDVLNIREAPTTASAVTGQIRDRLRYTVVGEAQGEGSASGWGRLKSGAGWIALDWVDRTG